MKWLIDAQLPRRLAVHLNDAGQDAVHTLELPDGNATTDTEISRFAAAEDRIVVSKDRDFLDSFIVTGKPSRLLWVTAGNISNNELMILFEKQLTDIQDSFQQCHCVELSSVGLTMHS